MTTTTVLPRAPPPIREADLVLGSILLVCSMVGIPANCAACYHFIAQTTKNKNSSFFKRIYTIISVIDVLIIVVQLPIAQTLILGRDSPDLMFREVSLCYSWYLLWLLLKQGAVFMVAFLSISRLTILMTSNRVMRLRNSWLVPALFAGFVLVVLGVVPLTTQYAVVQYRADNAMCRITVYDPALTPPSVTPPTEHTVSGSESESGSESVSTWATLTAPDHRGYFLQSFVVTITEACFIGLPVFPIFISFILSLKFLKKADRRSLRISTHHDAGRRRMLVRKHSIVNNRKYSRKDNRVDNRKDSRGDNKPVTKHKEASVTILMVTLTYVIFNIPALCMTVYLAYIYCRCLTLLYSPHFSTARLYEYASTVYTTFGPAWQYTWLLVYGVSQVFNSTVNPLLYWWRMRHFRLFVARGRLRVSESTRTLRSTWSRSYLSFTSSFEMRPSFRSSSKYHSVNHNGEKV